MIYTLEDLKVAREDLDKILKTDENYSGNNPNKYRSSINSARLKVSTIEDYLKSDGQIPYAEQEILNQELNSLYPDARSKMIVDYKGIKYQATYTPAMKSRSGNVQLWDLDWVKV